MNNDRKAAIISALRDFIEQRPGIEPRNYGDGMDGWRAYRQESASVTRDLHQARELLRAVEWRDSITADQIIETAKHSYSGRLTIVEPGAIVKVGSRESSYPVVTIEYCTGQYFATEFRRAVCALCGSLLFAAQREAIEPRNGAPNPREAVGELIRHSLRREFGRTLQSRWMD